MMLDDQRQAELMKALAELRKRVAVKDRAIYSALGILGPMSERTDEMRPLETRGLKSLIAELEAAL